MIQLSVTHVLLAVLFGLLSSCGVPSGKIGGIVDNGNKPSRDEEPKQSEPDKTSPSPQADSPSSPGSDAPTTDETLITKILGMRYQVTMPSVQGILEADGKHAKFQFKNGHTISFIVVDTLCADASLIRFMSNSRALWRCLEDTVQVEFLDRTFVEVKTDADSKILDAVSDSLILIDEP